MSLYIYIYIHILHSHSIQGRVTPRSREQQTVWTRPPTRQKWCSLVLQHVFSSRGLQPWNASTHRSAPATSYTRTGWGNTRKGARPPGYDSFASGIMFFATRHRPALLLQSSSSRSQERYSRARLSSSVLRIPIRTSIGSDVSHGFRRAVLS